MPAAQRRRRTKAEWAELVLQYETSGMEADAFAREHDLNPRTLQWWRSQLKVGSSYRRRTKGPKPPDSRRPEPRPARSEAARISGIGALTERLVDKLVAEPGQTTATLSTELRFAHPVVRTELKQLEELRIVYRQGHGRGVRWFVG